MVGRECFVFEVGGVDGVIFVIDGMVVIFELDGRWDKVF